MLLITLFRMVFPSDRIASCADIVPVSSPVMAFEAFPLKASTALVSML